jgi:hypothetical protein
MRREGGAEPPKCSVIDGYITRYWKGPHLQAEQHELAPM